MSQELAFTLDGESVLHGVVHLPEKPGPRPAVLICHGFKGFMDWGFFPPLAELLAERGFTAVRFNYSGSGMQPRDELVTDLDAFRRNTFSQEAAETLRLLAALGEEVAPGRVDRSRLALVGHSRGGGAALLAAAHPDWRERLGALVTWAGVATFDRYADGETKALWRRRGELPVTNARTGQELALGVELLDDIEQNRERLDLVAAAGRRRAPWLIVHARDDEAVPAAEAEALAEAAAPTAELEIVGGGGHTFGARHPFAGPSRELIQAMNATQRWLRRHLGT